jgi:hypothetical protein
MKVVAALCLGNVLLLSFAAACARSPRADLRSTPNFDAPSARQSDHLIKAAEIQSARVSTALEAVRRLRPELLSRRAPTAPGDAYGGKPVVYVDRVRQGGLETLETIPANAIVDIRYVTANAAVDWAGAYHPGGVILVRTRR